MVGIVCVDFDLEFFTDLQIKSIDFCILGLRDGLSGSTEFTIPIFNDSSTLVSTKLPQATTEQPAPQPQPQPHASTTESITSTANTSFSNPTTVTNTLSDVFPPLSCNITPPFGDSLSPFNIRCTVAPSFCKDGPCVFCFRTSTGMKTLTSCL